MATEHSNSSASEGMEDEKKESMEMSDGEEENVANFIDEGSPRLVIRQMVLENFKSYGGERVIGPFHKSFSAVVGPNGSGKSNVIDALLFVFGKRAAQLRLKRVSELIHHSTDERPAQAKVSVYFHEILDTGDGDEDYEIVPNSEVVLSRIARRDNTSVYQWNGSTKPMSEIAKYLQRKGVDLQHNRFLILQGEVEQISLMPPKAKDENSSGGLLEYLEDMIGSHKYVPATEEASAKVEECTVQRQEALGRLQAVSREKEGLQAAQQEARALLQAEQNLRAAQHLYAQLQKYAYDRQEVKLAADRENTLARLEDTRKTLGEADDQMTEYNTRRTEEQNAYDRIYKELLTTQEEFQAFERRDIKLRADCQHAKKQLQKFTKQIEQSKAQYTKAEHAVQAASEEVPLLEKKIESFSNKLTTEKAKLEEMFESRQAETQALRQELDEVATTLSPLVEARSTAQANLSTAQTALSLATSATEQLEGQIKSSRVELEQLDAKKQSQKEHLDRSKQDLQRMTQQQTELKEEDSVLAEKEAQVGKKHKSLVARVEEAKAALASSGGRNKPSRAVQGILKASRAGGPLSKVGLLGRLGDLAAIHADYDVAISTACGMLDHLVVQTTAGAQRCLEFLRKHDLGRANFIPLDKLSKGAHDRPVATPEEAPRLMDLLQYKQPALAPALFLAVGNTLVAPDLETATRWAYEYDRRWRVVTLDGKVIDTAGTMSGGGKAVKKGGMRLTNVKKAVASEEDEGMDEYTNDLELVQEELKKAQDILQQIRARRKDIQAEIRQITKDLKILKSSIPKLELEISNSDTTRENLTTLIPQLEQQLKEKATDEKEIKKLQDQVETCGKELRACTEKAAELESKKEDLQKSILNAGGKEWKKQESKCKKLQADIDATEKEIRTVRVSITTNEKNMTKAEKAISKAEAQLSDCKETFEKHQSDLKALEEDALVVMQAFEKVKVLEADKKVELESIEKEFEDLKRSQSASKCLEIELLGQIEAFDKQLDDCHTKSSQWGSEMAKIEAAAKQDDEEWGDFQEEEDDAPEEDMQMSSTEGHSDSEGGIEEMKEVDNEEVGEDQNVGKETKKVSGLLPIFTPEMLKNHDRDTVKERIAVLETERNSIAKNANLGAIAEFRKKETEYLARVAELDAITEERNGHRRTYEELRRKRLEMFMEGFGQITLKLKEMYQMITLGGDAELELVDSLDPFSEGIVFSVRPPKKSWKNISNLSGGEKTLSSLALVFALHHYKPTPLYVMDEIDAALDFKNVSIVANYIKERTRNAQFVIISLRNNMFELADRLVGIYKTNNCTKSVTINPRAFGIEARQNGLLATTPALLNKTNKRVESAAKESARRRLSIHSDASVGSAVDHVGE